MKRIIFLVLLFGWFGVYSSELSQFYPIVEKDGFSFQYNPRMEHPAWVAYILSPLDLDEEHPGRENCYFVVDKDVPYKQGADDNPHTQLGHLCPAADRPKNKKSTFIFTNQCPMLNKFNMGIWKVLETSIRKRCLTNNEKLLIITGPVGEKELPSHFFKIVKSLKDNNLKVYLIPHKELSDSPENYLVDLSTVELLTGIFFVHLR